MPGLYAAGDAASREPICGGFTGGGSHNAAWAMSTGRWAGTGAAAHARIRRDAVRDDRPLRGLGTAGLHAGTDDLQRVAAVQAEVMPLERNYFRQGARLDDSLGRLDALWRQAGAATGHRDGPAALRLRRRESAAMLAHARWMYRSAQARRESRGMHKREDHPGLDPAARHLLRSGGLDRVWTRIDPAAAVPARRGAAP